MDINQTIANNLSKIFKGPLELSSMYSSISGAVGREINTFDTNSIGKDTSFDIIVGKGNSKKEIIFVPKIKNKNERDWLVQKVAAHVDNHLDDLKENIMPFYDEELKATWTTNIKKHSISSTQSYVIEAAVNKGFDLRIVFSAKGLTSGGKLPDPHELMTACLILKKQKINVSTINALSGDKKLKKIKEIVDGLYGVAGDVVGGSGLPGFYLEKERINPDCVNFAKAVSISNVIIDKLKGAKIHTIWQTGKQWAQEIRKYDVQKDDLKHYNSSDIVIKFETTAIHYWGISLKKADWRATGPDEPTLLNKPMYGANGFIQKRIKPGEAAKVEKAKKIFFCGAMKIKHGECYKKKRVVTMNIKELLKGAEVSFVGNDKADMLRGQGEYKSNPNIYFKAMNDVFMANFDGKKDFFSDFLDTVFKFKLQSYLEDAVFHFTLITGVGDWKNGDLKVQEMEEIWHKTTTEVFRELFGDATNTQFRLVPGFDKTGKARKQAYQEGATAAKLFYDMRIGPKGGEHTIVNIEVRYKGALTAEPQFQVFFSTAKNGFKALYKRTAAKLANEPRW